MANQPPRTHHNLVFKALNPYSYCIPTISRGRSQSSFVFFALSLNANLNLDETSAACEELQKTCWPHALLCSRPRMACLVRYIAAKAESS